MKIDVIGYIGAVTREVQNCEHNGKPAHVVVAVCNYDSEIDDVWDALTNIDRIPKWFLPITGDLRVGGRFQFQGNAGGEITHCEPPSRFEVTWECMGDISWVNIKLSADAKGGTRLRLEHIAYANEHWNQYGPGAVGLGWEGGLMGLRMHLSGNPPVDPKEAATWQVSENGKDFYRRSSEEWCKAHIASGTDEAAAKAAAARTTAAYTGEV